MPFERLLGNHMASALGSVQQYGGARAWRWIGSATAQLAVLTLLTLAVATPAAAGCDDDDRPPAPISLKANPLGSGGIMLQWSSNAGHYDIAIRDKQGRPVPEAPDIIGGATNENYHEFYGLQPDKEYFFTIRARTEGGTQGCISKNASETVSAKTDSTELNRICSNYAQTVMEDIQEMTSKQCALPGNSFSGLWARSEGTHFTACLEQRRAGLQGDAKAEWLRHQDLVACKESADKCTAYRQAAVSAARKNRIFGCGYTGARWTFDGSAHYSWCMGQSADSALPRREARARTQRIRICLAKRASAAQGSGSSSGGDDSGDACTGLPAEWAGMLKAHNDLRGQYCAAPLTWSCDLAKGAKEYADKCILNAHGNPPGIGENMADREAFPDKFPASSDEAAFQDTWGCEKDLYDFKNPVIVGGFKTNCLPPPAGTGVNGHFTQVVWRGTTQLGCARARCTVKDDKGVDHNLTHWVCRYGPGGNDSGALAQNVQKPPACGQTFRSRSFISCVRGMIATADGLCACPPGRVWNGRYCIERSLTPIPPRQTGGTCPRDRPVGSPPNCCPEGTTYQDGVCSVPKRSAPSLACTGDRPVGVYPNCCPAGTFFSDGVCRSGSGGTNDVHPGGGESCPRSRPIGTYPNCCPRGMTFDGGACRPPVGSGGTNGVHPGGGESCPRSRPVGTYPNCCPRGMTFNGSACRPPVGSGGTNGVHPGANEGCPHSRPIGRPPNCCPAGTSYQNGKCIRPTPQPTQQVPTTQPGTSSGSCTGGRIGRPPHCRCPAGTRYLGRRCLRIRSTTPGPTPKATCPSGLTGPKCDQVIVR